MANILVVQDVEVNISDIQQSLEPAGHQILVARSVDAAKILLNAATFDLLICGVHLEHGTVFDLLKFVKSEQKMQSLPVVFFCCSPKEIAKHVSESVRKTALLLGAEKYITQEEFDSEQFRIEIESLLPVPKHAIQERPRKN